MPILSSRAHSPARGIPGDPRRPLHVHGHAPGDSGSRFHVHLHLQRKLRCMDRPRTRARNGRSQHRWRTGSTRCAPRHVGRSSCCPLRGRRPRSPSFHTEFLLRSPAEACCWTGSSFARAVTAGILHSQESPKPPHRIRGYPPLGRHHPTIVERRRGGRISSARRRKLSEHRGALQRSDEAWRHARLRRFKPGRRE